MAECHSVYKKQSKLRLQLLSMKSIWVILVCAPLFSAGQQLPKKTLPKKPLKTVVAKKPLVKKVVVPAVPVHIVESAPVKPVGGFLIRGTVTGFSDGTPVSIMNPQTGAPESQTTIRNNNFILQGKIPFADIKILVFNNQPPYLNLFLDSSDILFNGSKENLQNATISGSSTHVDFVEFNNAIAPYQEAFSPEAIYDSALFENAASICYNYAISKPASVIGAVALLRYMQASDDAEKTEQVYNTLTPAVKTHPIAPYIVSLITAAKSVPVGKLLDDFTQPDTAGIPVALSSLRGKYVLIDFWASWCGPCRRENPNVVNAFNKFRNKNFTVLGVSLDRNKIPWIDAIKMDGLDWTQLSDLAFWNNAVAKQFGINSIPQNYLIDPEGKIVGMNLRGAALHKKLSKLLK